MEDNKRSILPSIQRQVGIWADSLRSDTGIFAIWNSKYAKKDKHGNVIESPEERIYEIIEACYKKGLDVSKLFEDGLRYVIPGGRITAGIGDEDHLTSLSNCTVIASPNDSYGGICRAGEEMVQLMKRGCGVGVDLSGIRAKGAPVRNSAITSTGVVAFAERYSNNTTEVAQDGRRGALMISLDCDHPDSEDFIDAKLEQGRINGANISIKITDKFMEAALADSNSKPGKLLRKIAINMHEWAEPGILFWDSIITNTPRANYPQFLPVSTNPCGEIPLSPYDSCRIGHINVYELVVNKFKQNAKFDPLGKVVSIVRNMVDFMDCVVDLELDKIDDILNKITNDPEPESIKEVERILWKKMRKEAYDGRSIGIGITGYADMCSALWTPYTNIELAETVSTTIVRLSYERSIELAALKGAFPKWNLENTSDFSWSIINELSDYHQELYRTSGIRNLTLNTIAPVGTGSLILGVSSGIEPLFSVVTKRKRRVIGDEIPDTINEDGKWITMNIIHKPFVEYCRVAGIDHNNITEEVISESPFALSRDIRPYGKLDIQNVFQKVIDCSISITHNVNTNTTVDTVLNMIIGAYSRGLKGFTLYREGCSKNAILTSATAIDSRSNKLNCDVYPIVAENIKWLVILSYNSNKLYEIFAMRNKGEITIFGNKLAGTLEKVQSGKYNLITDHFIISDISKYYNSGDEEALTRTLTRLFQIDYPLNKIMEDLNKVNTPVTSIVSAIRRVLSKATHHTTTVKCECGGDMINIEGCSTCLSCGLSNC